jgi:hypothetical protein
VLEMHSDEKAKTQVECYLLLSPKCSRELTLLVPHLRQKKKVGWGWGGVGERERYGLERDSRYYY